MLTTGNTPGFLEPIVCYIDKKRDAVVMLRIIIMTVCTLRENDALTTKSGLITSTYCLHVIPRLARVYMILYSSSCFIRQHIFVSL